MGRLEAPMKVAGGRAGSTELLQRVLPQESKGPPLNTAANAAVSGDGAQEQLSRQLHAVAAVGMRENQDRLRWAVAGCLLGAAFLWSYWHAIGSLLTTWYNVPDYSHGFLVPPLAVFILWVRRDRMPLPSTKVAWLGLLPIMLSVTLRYAGARYYMDTLEGWSILPWIAGVAWLLFGGAIAMWTLPSVLFLFFMVPLPFRVERELSLPLQTIATKLSCWTLQILGQPALCEGHVIYLGGHKLEIEQACSGLRIFMGIAALAFAYVVVVRRVWWEKAILLASFIPIALIANSTRIVGTGLLWQYVSGEAAHKFSHDMAGLVMIPFAALLFALVHWYLSRLIGEVEPLDMNAVVRLERE
jgi:exosortase